MYRNINARIMITGRAFASGNFAAGTAIPIKMDEAHIGDLVWCKAAGATTIVVEYSVDGGVSYDAWTGAATVTSATISTDRQKGIDYALTHVRFTPSAADASSTYGITQ